MLASADKCLMNHLGFMQVAVDTHEFKLTGPSPSKFAVSDGMMFDVATASVPTLLRLGTGALNIGVSPGGYTSVRHVLVNLASEPWDLKTKWD